MTLRFKKLPDMTTHAFPRIIMILTLLLIVGPSALFADVTWDKNQNANKLYKQGKYDEALKLYDDAILTNPNEPKLKINKGSTLFRMGELDKAEEAFSQAGSLKDKNAQQALLYNQANTFYRQGQQLGQQDPGKAKEKFEAARDNYIKALDVNASDRDTKWNLQLAQMQIKKMEEQKKDQDKNKNQDKKQDKNQQNKDQQDKDKKDQDKKNQDQKNQDPKNQDQKKEQDKKDQQDQPQQDKKNQQDQPMPKPSQEKQDMKKEEAKRLLMQYADDADTLNKPHKKVQGMMQKNPEKDW